MKILKNEKYFFKSNVSKVVKIVEVWRIEGNIVWLKDSNWAYIWELYPLTNLHKVFFNNEI